MTLSDQDLGRIAFEAEQDRESWDLLDTVRQLDWMRVACAVRTAIEQPDENTPALYDESEVDEIRDIWRQRAIRTRNDMIAARCEASDLREQVARLEQEKRDLEEMVCFYSGREQQFWGMLPYVMGRRA